MTGSKLVRLGVAWVALLAAGCASAAIGTPGSPSPGGVDYSRVGTIRWTPAPATSVDISWIDSASRRYFVSDRTNGVVHIVNLDTMKQVAVVSGFAGARDKANASGPNGLVYVPDRGELWVGDGDSTLKVVDVRSAQIVASVAAGGSSRVDELAYDAKRHVVVATSPDEPTPYLSFISVADRHPVGRVNFPTATNGIEQPAWNPQDSYVYQAIPSTKANPGGEVAVIEPDTLRVTRSMGVAQCYPHGLAFGIEQHLLLACGKDSIIKGGKAKTVVVDAQYGNVLATITDVGGSDQAWFNSGDNRYYVAASDMTDGGTPTGSPAPVLGVIEAGTNRWLTNIPTSHLSHSVAVDSKTGRIVLPSDSGILIYALRH